MSEAPPVVGYRTKGFCVLAVDLGQLGVSHRYRNDIVKTWDTGWLMQYTRMRGRPPNGEQQDPVAEPSRHRSSDTWVLPARAGVAGPIGVAITLSGA